MSSCKCIQYKFLQKFYIKNISRTGGINKYEMLRTFNCGIGAVLICSERDKLEVLSKLKDENPVIIGSVNTHRGKKLLLLYYYC